ncbi:hypothetical protein PMAYCL1PPCAC_26925, partial [Pristionchus mayeri]
DHVGSIVDERRILPREDVAMLLPHFFETFAHLLLFDWLEVSSSSRALDEELDAEGDELQHRWRIESEVICDDRHLGSACFADTGSLGELQVVVREIGLSLRRSSRARSRVLARARSLRCSSARVTRGVETRHRRSQLVCNFRRRSDRGLVRTIVSQIRGYLK